MLRKQGATDCKISIKQTLTCRLICDACSRFPPNASHQEYRLADLLSMTYPQPNHPEKHPIAICLSRRQPLQPRLLRRIRGARGGTALHAAAWNGDAAVVEHVISAKATVDAANDDGRGPGRVFGSFWEWLWRDDGRGSHMGR